MSGVYRFRSALIASVLALTVIAATGVGSAATMSGVKGSSVTAGPAIANFGVIWNGWTRFAAPNGWYSLYLPPNWTYQEDQSSEELSVFYGPGQSDLFWVETFTLENPDTPVALVNALFRQYQSGEEALADFTVLQAPRPGTAENVPAAFTVYRYTDSRWGDTIEGLVLAVLGSRAVAKGGVFDWPGNRSRVLFVWNGFDEVNQQPFQYEVQVVLIDGVGTTAEQAMRDLVYKADPSGWSDANNGVRVRIGNLTGLKLVFYQSSLLTDVAKRFTIYAAKTGNTLVIITFPKEAPEAAVNQVLATFKWNS